MGDVKEKAPSQPEIRKLTTAKGIKKGANPNEMAVINLSRRGIKTIESLELPNLRRLDLSGNHLTRLKGLQGCPQVSYLQVANNELTGEGLEGVRNFPDLKVFNASGNKLKLLTPAVFGKFRNLQALVLANNEISEVPPSWFNKRLQASLNTLVLSHNKVDSLTGAKLGRLGALTKLSLSHNMLRELPDLSPCSALEELRAAHNRLAEVPAHLSKNTALRTLDLGHNTIQDWDGVEHLRSLTRLVQLSLAGNPICGGDSKDTSKAGEVDINDEGGGGQTVTPAGQPDSTYVEKMQSLFPALKVRDGRRTLLKKSHTYKDQHQATRDNASAEVKAGARKRKQATPPEPTSPKTPMSKKGPKGHNKETAKKGRDSAEGITREAGSTVKKLRASEGDEDQIGIGGQSTATTRSNSSNGGGKIPGQKVAEGLPPVSTAAETENEGTPSTVHKMKRGKKGRHKHAGAVEAPEGAPPTTEGKARKAALGVGREMGSEGVGGSTKAGARGSGETQGKEKNVRVPGTLGQEGKKAKKVRGDKMKVKKVEGEEELSLPFHTVSNQSPVPRGNTDNDPDYSSAEELSQLAGNASGKRGGGGERRPDAGASEQDGSSVVAVVVVTKKQQRGAGGVKGIGGKGKVVRGEGVDGGKSFSIEAMLKARAERETVGWGGGGDGASAWD